MIQHFYHSRSSGPNFEIFQLINISKYEYICLLCYSILLALSYQFKELTVSRSHRSANIFIIFIIINCHPIVTNLGMSLLNHIVNVSVTCEIYTQLTKFTKVKGFFTFQFFLCYDIINLLLLANYHSRQNKWIYVAWVVTSE